MRPVKEKKDDIYKFDIVTIDNVNINMKWFKN